MIRMPSPWDLLGNTSLNMTRNLTKASKYITVISFGSNLLARNINQIPRPIGIIPLDQVQGDILYPLPTYTGTLSYMILFEFEFEFHTTKPTRGTHPLPLCDAKKVWLLPICVWQNIHLSIVSCKQEGKPLSGCTISNMLHNTNDDWQP